MYLGFIGKFLFLDYKENVLIIFTEMISHKRVFPTKSNGWVTLAHKPMIADSPHLEKIFKSHHEICLLNLPSAMKKAANKLKHQGNALIKKRKQKCLSYCNKCSGLFKTKF